MGVMHIPGHSHQAPREVALEAIVTFASFTSRAITSCLAWETPTLA